MKIERAFELPHWLEYLLANYGYGAIFTVLFLNNVGLPVPGNTLLLGAGFLVGRNSLSLWAVVATATVACFMGTNCGYWLGRRYGLTLVKKIRWLRLTHQRVYYLEHFFKRYGPKGVFFARFLSLLHPFIGLLAGLGKTPGRAFLFYNLAGSVVYSVLFTLAGDYLGQRWGFFKIWMLHTGLFILILVIVILLLSLFLRHSIHIFFGYPFFRRKNMKFW
jgi:membrane protein DedA with SNARE-associated domain